MPITQGGLLTAFYFVAAIIYPLMRKRLIIRS